MARMLFMDSGAHTLINQAVKSGKKKRHGIDYSLYETKLFWDYVDEYAEFIKKHSKIIDLYPNVDVIRNPEKSWEVQQYLEKEHGLKPIPVVHYNTAISWVEHYLERDYKFLALGGPIKRQGSIYHKWADNAWNAICSGPGYLPLVKVHGFSVTTHKHICRYPWWSVDSVTWKKMAYYGQILVPQKRGGQFDFSIPNLVIFIDPNTKYTKREGVGRHYKHLVRTSRKHVREWLDSIEVPFGKSRKDGSIIIAGVSNDEIVRRAATIKYYQHLAKSLPKWPWPFHKAQRNNLAELL